MFSDGHLASKVRQRSELTRCARSGCKQMQQRSPLFDHLVGALLKQWRHVEAKGLGGL